RRRGGGARGCSDGDAVRAVAPGSLAHQARGHEGGAPRACGAGARPADGEDDRLARLSGPAAATPERAVYVHARATPGGRGFGTVPPPGARDCADCVTKFCTVPCVDATTPS